MNTWYSKEIGDGIEAYQPSIQIQKIFTPIFLAAGCPFDMAVFSRYDIGKNIVTVYFTPTAYEIAKKFNASPCEKPSSSGLLGLLIGDVRCWGIFYPSTK